MFGLSIVFGDEASVWVNFHFCVNVDILGYFQDPIGIA